MINCVVNTDACAGDYFVYVRKGSFLGKKNRSLFFICSSHSHYLIEGTSRKLKARTK